MQSPPRGIHVVGRPGPVQLKKLDGEFGGVRWLNSSFAPGSEELLDPTVPKAPDHPYSVARPLLT